MAFPRELVKQWWDVIPGHVRVVARVLRCQSIKCPFTGAGAWTTCVQVPLSEVVPAEGALSPRARRTSPKGALSPRARRTLPEGGLRPRARRTLPEGASRPRTRRTPLVGGHSALERGGPYSRGVPPCRPSGPGGHQDSDRVVRVL
jgi:hypothetical protein